MIHSYHLPSWLFHSSVLCAYNIIPWCIIIIFQSSGMSCCVAGWVGPDILKDHHSFVFRVKESKKTGPLVPSKLRPHNLVTYQKPIAQWYSNVSQKTCILNNTPVITSNLTVLSLFVMPDASHLNSERMLRGFLLKATRVMQQIMTLSSHMMKIWLEGTFAKVLFIRFVSSDLRKYPPGSEKDWTVRDNSSQPTCSPLYLNFSCVVVELKITVSRYTLAPPSGQHFDL